MGRQWLVAGVLALAVAAVGAVTIMVLWTSSAAAGGWDCVRRGAITRSSAQEQPSAHPTSRF